MSMLSGTTWFGKSGVVIVHFVRDNLVWEEWCRNHPTNGMSSSFISSNYCSADRLLEFTRQSVSGSEQSVSFVEISGGIGMLHLQRFCHCVSARRSDVLLQSEDSKRVQFF